MCVLSIKVPIRKKSGNLFNDPCILCWGEVGLKKFKLYIGRNVVLERTEAIICLNFLLEMLPLMIFSLPCLSSYFCCYFFLSFGLFSQLATMKQASIIGYLDLSVGKFEKDKKQKDKLRKISNYKLLMMKTLHGSNTGYIKLLNLPIVGVNKQDVKRGSLIKNCVPV